MDATNPLLAGFHTHGVTPQRPGAYARISDDPRGLEAGVTRQLEDAQIKARNLGWPQDLKPYVENDTSAFCKRRVTLADGTIGYRVIRPVYRQALADLNSGKIDGLLVYDLDRLARETRDLDDLIDVVTATRRPVRGVTSDIDLMTADGQLTARVIVSAAQKSSQDTGRRVARAAAASAADGIAHRGGYRPFGWEDDCIHLNADEAPVLARAITDFADGASLADLFRTMVTSGISTVSGHPWRSVTIRRMIGNPRAAGIAIYGGKGRLVKPVQNDWQSLVIRNPDGSYVMGNWEPVVPVEVWEQANARLDAQKATQPWRRKHLLSGILRCGLCGAKMYVRPRSDGNPRFVCPSPASGGCGRLARKSEPLNIQVCELVARRLDLLHAIPAPEPILTVDRTSPIRERIAELQARYVDGTISGEIFYATLPQLEQRLAAAVKETRKATVPIPVGKLRDTWLDPKASLSQRVAVLADLITAIEVLPVKYPRHREKELRVFWAGEGSTAGEPSRR